MITARELREILSYNPHNGVFRWKVRLSPRSNPGEQAGHINGRGYRTIKIRGKHYYAHRLAWLYHTGYFPNDEIDHINNDKLDNRLVNLREVTRWENQQNRIDTKLNGGLYKNSARYKEMRAKHSRLQWQRKKAIVKHSKIKNDKEK